MFTGYSALSIALALPPDGKLYTCDTSDAYLDIASDAWKMVSSDTKWPAYKKTLQILVGGQFAIGWNKV